MICGSIDLCTINPYRRIFLDFVRHNPLIYRCFVLICSVALLNSCENSIDEINQVASVSQLPDLTGTNTVVYYSDSAVLKLRMEAPVVEFYQQREEPIKIFPKGIKVYFYDDQGKEDSKLTALWSAYYEKKDLWEVKGNVTYTNVQGVRLNTEQAFWNRRKALIYSDKFTRYTDKDGTNYTGEYGFEASQDMSRWKLIDTRKSSITVVE